MCGLPDRILIPIEGRLFPDPQDAPHFYFLLISNLFEGSQIFFVRLLPLIIAELLLETRLYKAVITRFVDIDGDLRATENNRYDLYPGTI
jgi:hypothetical protein